jgi:methionine-rich copper-binding protein CopC
VSGAVRQRRRLRPVAALAVPTSLAAALLAAAVLGVAAAHASLESAEPPPGHAHVGPLATIALHYTMPVEARFSRFEVFALPLPEGAEPTDPHALTTHERQRLEALAATFARELESGAMGEQAEARVETTVRERGATRTITLDIAEPLGAGVYLVLWEVLATDAHTTRDHLLVLVVEE